MLVGTWVSSRRDWVSDIIGNNHMTWFICVTLGIWLFPFLYTYIGVCAKMVSPSLVRVCGWIHRLPFWIPEFPCLSYSCSFPSDIGWSSLLFPLFIHHMLSAGSQSNYPHPSWGSWMQIVFCWLILVDIPSADLIFPTVYSPQYYRIPT